jgi:aminoglycoside phosphotransferase (APT) family kinase protein
MLFHHDLSMQNILVDDKGGLTGVIDWECVSILPLWAACDFPAFLQSKNLDEEPSSAEYDLAEDFELEGYENAELYLENLRNYNLTQLRRLFLDEMRRIEPRWVKIYESSQRQRDFDLAVSSCDDELYMRRIENWLNDIGAGVVNLKGLQQRMDEGTL